jgi:DNA repair exonuclease SbcCD nuclease subunit
MKAFLIADTHLGVHPLKLDYWLNDVTRNYFDDFFIPLVEKRKQEDDIIIHLGDFFDDRSIIPVNVLHYGNKLMEQLSSLLPVHIILGNHDLYSEYDNSIHSMDWCRHIPNVSLYEEHEVITLGMKKCLMLPWVQRKKDEVQILNNTVADYVFCHSDLKGAYNNKSRVIKHGIDIQNYNKFKQVWSGHIHLRQKTHNFQFVGSPYHLDRNDIGDKKGVYILDIETGDAEFVPNNISPEYKVIEIKNEKDLDKLEAKELKKDRFDLKIANSLLLENKKIRSQVERLLQEKKFEQIKWQDDLKLEDVIEEKNIDFSTQSIDFEIKKLIYDYMNKQNFENEDVNHKIFETLDELFEVYENQSSMNGKKKTK